MMRMSLPVVLALTVFLTLSNGDSRESLEMDRAMSQFAVNIYKELALNETNAIYSPASIHLVLSMAYLGANGSTAEEMRTALQIPNATNIHEWNRKWLDYLAAMNASTVLVGNSVWSNPSIVVRQEYKSELVSQYYADVGQLNFSSPDGPEKPINDWVANKTFNEIRDIIPKGQLKEIDTSLVLVNAIYFNGTWEHQFNTEVTKKGIFNTPDNREVEVEFMSQSAKFEYKEKAFMGASLVRLPFSNSDISFNILLPKTVSGLAHIEQGLSSDSRVLDSLFDGMTRQDLSLSMPKFRLEASMKLNKPLINLGIQKAFSTDAEFFGVSNVPVLISEVAQKAIIEVTESGTVAGATTALQEVEMFLTPFVDVSRSFLFFLRDDRNKRIMFQGKLTDPSVTEVNIK